MKDFKFKINGNEHNVHIANVDGNLADVEVNGTPYRVEMERSLRQTKTPKPNQARRAPPTDSHPSVVKRLVPIHLLRYGKVSAPPGVVLMCWLNPATRLVGSAYFLAIKMENNIDSDKAGRVTRGKG